MQVIEFISLSDPVPMMYWHLSEALSQSYWMLPVPEGHPGAGPVIVPVEDVSELLHRALVPYVVRPYRTRSCCVHHVPRDSLQRRRVSAEQEPTPSQHASHHHKLCAFTRPMVMDAKSRHLKAK